MSGCSVATLGRNCQLQISELVGKSLIELGVSPLFGLMGDANMAYVGTYRESGGHFVGVAHEGNAVVMADAHARVSGRLGVVSVTHGPAFTNTLTALVEAQRAGTPLLVITGSTPLEPTHFQRVGIEPLCLALEIGFDKVYQPASLTRDLSRAVQRAWAEKRPIVLDIPLSIVEQEAPPQAPVRQPTREVAAVPSFAALENVLGIAAGARRPVILAGRGAVESGARDALIRLAELMDGVLATTLLANGLFDGHPRNIGIFGSFSHPLASQTISEADAVLAFGASLNIHTTFRGSLIGEGVRLVQVDTNSASIGAYLAPEEAVIGDANEVAKALIEALTELLEPKAPGVWASGVIQKLGERNPADEFVDHSAEATIDPRTATLIASGILPENRTVVSDIGRFIVASWPRMRVFDPQYFTTMGAFGSIGLGLGGAIGASIADPSRTTVALCGDAGFMMHLSELTTAVREKLPIVVLVYNDGALGAEYYRLPHYGLPTSLALTDWPELSDVARAMGAGAVEVRCAEDFAALEALLAAPLTGPVIVDLRLDPDLNMAATS